MKKIILLLLLFLIVFPSATLADDSTASATISPTVVVNDYTLPYPGILPDNPLYAIKAFRDKVITFFISDPLKKSAFFLLQSDKRLEASWYLLKKDAKHTDLVLSTLSKSTTYLSMSIDQLQDAQKHGEDTHAQVDSLINATAKHLGIVNQMLQLPGLANKSGFMQEEKRLMDIENGVSKISKK